MNMKLIYAMTVLATISISSCTKQGLCPLGSHPEKVVNQQTGAVTTECVLDDEYGSQQNQNQNTTGAVAVLQLVPYKNAIVTEVSAVAAYQDNGSGYAKTEITGNVSTITYKQIQIWVYVGNGRFEPAVAGIDNHSSGSTPSLFRTLQGKMEEDVLGLVLNSVTGNVNQFTPTGKYAVLSLSNGSMKGSTRYTDETNRSKNISSSNPEKFRLSESDGFEYEVTGVKVEFGSTIFSY